MSKTKIKMNSKNLLLKIKSPFLINELFYYIPQEKILKIVKYNNKIKKILNINLNTRRKKASPIYWYRSATPQFGRASMAAYQKEYLLTQFELSNPLNYNISHLYNKFKRAKNFDREKDKEIFIKLLQELFTEENIIPKIHEFAKIDKISHLKKF